MRENRLAGGNACPTFGFEWGRRFRLPTGIFNEVGACLSPATPAQGRIISVVSMNSHQVAIAANSSPGSK